ncbi:MAG: hypothetical protein WA738_17095 [Candidatus Angelobacter sp.]
MRAPKVYLLAILVTICALPAAGYAQTSNAQLGQDAANSQDSSPKPSNPGESSAPGTLPNSGQAAPGKIGGLSPTQRATPANPPAADQNSPLLTAPIQSPAEVLQNASFEFLFNNISDFDQIADSNDKAGKHAEAALWRTHEQKGAGLNDAEGQILQETAVECLRALKEQDAKIQAAVEKDRAQRAPGVRGPTPPELIQLVEERKKIVSDHVEKLRGALGDNSFNKLDNYVHSSFHAEVTVPKTRTPERSQKDKQ